MNVFNNYIELVKKQHKVSAEFIVEEVGTEISHIEGNGMLDLEDELPRIHHLKLPEKYKLVGCRFTKSKNLKYFIIYINEN